MKTQPQRGRVNGDNNHVDPRDDTRRPRRLPRKMRRPSDEVPSCHLVTLSPCHCLSSLHLADDRDRKTHVTFMPNPPPRAAPPTSVTLTQSTRTVVTLLRCYVVTLSRCYVVTLSRCYVVTLLRCYVVTAQPPRPRDKPTSTCPWAFQTWLRRKPAPVRN